MKIHVTALLYHFRISVYECNDNLFRIFACPYMKEPVNRWIDSTIRFELATPTQLRLETNNGRGRCFVDTAMALFAVEPDGQRVELHRAEGGLALCAAAQPRMVRPMLRSLRASLGHTLAY